MKKFNILFCETNHSLVSNAVAFFSADDDIQIVPVSTGKDAIEYIRGNDLSGIMIDVTFDRCKEIATLCYEKNVLVIAFSKVLDDENSGILAQIPHDACFFKPYSLIEVKAKFLKMALQQMVKVKLNVGARSIDERLSGIFIRAGIPPHIKGYQFLREAVKLAVAYPEMINAITKKLYPTIAEIYQTTPSKVERAIRHAIEVAWNRGKIENINAIFGIKIYNKGEKPTNGELIALVADKILIESL